jgi:hypothetical protein
VTIDSESDEDEQASAPKKTLSKKGARELDLLCPAYRATVRPR